MTANRSIHPLMARRIRLAGALLLAALAIEAISLLWSNPTAFLIFAGLGGALLAAGIFIFLYSLVSVPAHDQGRSPAD